MVFGSRHFDWRRSRNGEISFLDLSASYAVLTSVEMTGISSEAGMEKSHAREATLPYNIILYLILIPLHNPFLQDIP